MEYVSVKIRRKFPTFTQNNMQNRLGIINKQILRRSVIFPDNHREYVITSAVFEKQIWAFEYMIR